MKKFEFNLIISNPKGSSNVKSSVTLETCTVSVYYFAWYLCYMLYVFMWLMAVIMFGYKHVEIPEIVILI